MVNKLHSILESQLDPVKRLSESAVELTDKQKLSLYKKSQNSGISVDILEEVYRRGLRTFNEQSFAGTQEQFAFDRVNSFIAGGFAMDLDKDLVEAGAGDVRTLKSDTKKYWKEKHRLSIQKRDHANKPQPSKDEMRAEIEAMLSKKKNVSEDLKGACWKGYTAIGTKKKNGRTVPNCVPKEENTPSVREIGTDSLTTIYANETPGQSAFSSVIKKVVREHCGCPSEKAYNKKLKYYRAVIESENLNEISDEAKQKYIPIASRDASLANMAKRNSQDPKEQEYWARKEKNRKKGLVRAFKEEKREYNKIDPRSSLEKKLMHATGKKKIEEATYQGKKVPLNKPMKGDVKKSKVYVDPDGDGKAQKVNFGDKNMTIKKNIPARRKSFRARHNCDNPGPKTKARYWSCKAW